MTIEIEQCDGCLCPLAGDKSYRCHGCGKVFCPDCHDDGKWMDKETWFCQSCVQWGKEIFEDVEMKTDQNQFTCKQCGQCCINNGFLPPYTSENSANDRDKENKPKWYDAFRQAVLDIIPVEEYEAIPCMFLHDKKCLVHENKPAVCREFGGEDCCND